MRMILMWLAKDYISAGVFSEPQVKRFRLVWAEAPKERTIPKLKVFKFTEYSM